MLTIKVKRESENAIIPTKSNESDAGWDIYSSDCVEIHGKSRQLVGTDISMCIPDGYCLVLKDRSGLAYKHGLTVLAGIIDSEYRGKIGCVIHNSSNKTYTVNIGDRIAQGLLLPVPDSRMLEVDNLDSSERGSGGFGSTGK